MQKAFHRDIHRVAGAAADDGACRRRRHVAAAGVARFGPFDLTHAANGILDGPIAGAAANVAFQRRRQILALRLVEARSRDDHSRRAEAALEALGLQEGLLHGMQFAVARQSFDRRDKTLLGAIGRKQAGMHRIAVD